jgi:hypothetical protein
MSYVRHNRVPGQGEEEIMSLTKRAILASAVLLGGIGTVGMSQVHAQMAMSGGGRSLGGYGATAISSYYSAGSSTYIPYSGNAHGFIPYRGGSAGGLGAQPIPRRLSQTSIGGVMMADTPIGGASLSGGMGGDARSGMSMGARSARGRQMLMPFGYEGGIGMGGMATMSGGMGRRPMSTGPGFGYPFRMPMNLGGSSSMAMP